MRCTGQLGTGGLETACLEHRPVEGILFIQKTTLDVYGDDYFAACLATRGPVARMPRWIGISRWYLPDRYLRRQETSGSFIQAGMSRSAWSTRQTSMWVSRSM